MSFKMFYRDWNPRQLEEVDWLLPTSMETPDQLEPEGWWCWLPLTSPPTPQKNVQELIIPCPLNHYCKTPHHPLQVSTHTSGDISPLWIPLPGKAIKPFLSTSLKLCLQDRIWHSCTDSNLWHHLRDGTGLGWVFIIRWETKWLGNPF